MSLVDMGPADAGEILTLSLGYTRRLQGRTIVSAASSCVLLAGSDADPSGILSGDPVVASPRVNQLVNLESGSREGCVYMIKLRAVLNDGNVLIGKIKLEVLS